MDVLARFWRLLAGRWQWRLLWLINAKFIIGVSGVILNEDGHILLLRHRFWKPGTWGLPSGYVQKGECLEAALAREVHEETGYHTTIDSLVHTVSGYRLRFEAYFLGRVVGGTPRLDPREVIEMRFFALDDLPYGLLPSQRSIVDMVVEKHYGKEVL